MKSRFVILRLKTTHQFAGQNHPPPEVGLVIAVSFGLSSDSVFGPSGRFFVFGAPQLGCSPGRSNRRGWAPPSWVLGSTGRMVDEIKRAGAEQRALARGPGGPPAGAGAGPHRHVFDAITPARPASSLSRAGGNVSVHDASGFAADLEMTSPRHRRIPDGLGVVSSRIAFRVVSLQRPRSR